MANLKHDNGTIFIDFYCYPIVLLIPRIRFPHKFSLIKSYSENITTLLWSKLMVPRILFEDVLLDNNWLAF